MDDNHASRELFGRACAVIPGGVNSPVRAFGAVGGTPLFIRSGHGSRIITADGVELVDFCGSWGPLLLGHAHPAVVGAIQAAAAAGTSFGACTEAELELAEWICRRVPGIERIRLVSSGTEACMTAVRLARGVTGRSRILKFDGCYHGHSDSLLVSAGSGLLTGGIASSAGVPPAVAAETIVVPYNDLDAVRVVMAQAGADVAAILVEPVAGNMGLVPPAAGFLEGLSELARRSGALLIFDEVITGFRLGPTTFGALRGITPDLTCLGKIIGGGLPLGALGGRADIMEQLAPVGPVYQAGTLSGNPVAVAAGLQTLRLLEDLHPYARIEAGAATLSAALAAHADASGQAVHVSRIGGMLTLFFCRGPVRNLADARHSDTAAYARFFQAMLRAGFYFPPSQFEVWFVSAAHTTDELDRLAAVAGEAMRQAGS